MEAMGKKPVFVWLPKPAIYLVRDGLADHAARILRSGPLVTGGDHAALKDSYARLEGAAFRIAALAVLAVLYDRDLAQELRSQFPGSRVTKPCRNPTGTKSCRPFSAVSSSSSGAGHRYSVIPGVYLLS